MIKKKLLSIILISCFFSITNQSYAALIEADDSVFGTNAITIDTVTGLQWLDVNYSYGYSHNEINTELQTGGIFEGYRYATVQETQYFVSVSAGIPDIPGYFGNYEPALALTGLISEQADVTLYALFGIETGDRYWFQINGGNQSTNEAEVLMFAGNEEIFGLPLTDDDSMNDVGHMLVKTTAVPLPSSIILLISGILGLFSVKRKASN